MVDMKIPAFEEEKYFDEQSNEFSRVITITGCNKDAYGKYLSYFEKNGGVKKEEFCTDCHSYAAFLLGTDGVFVNYYDRLKELTISLDENTAYFSYADEMGEKCVEPQITQVELNSYGMSYVIRLSDGRFIVIDGGWNKESDIESLYECLQDGAMGKKPVIASWILTHPHEDHYLCFIGFMEKYADAVEVQKYMFYFPDVYDFVHYPNLEIKRIEVSTQLNVPRMLEIMEKTGAPIYTPHTGQRYQIGDAYCEILSSMDDTIHCTTNSNAISLIIRMELAGQVILWGADGSFSYSRLAEKHGARLKTDILQIPHHGFQSGTPDGEIKGYDLIKPEVCLLPTSEYYAFVSFCIHRKSTHYLMNMPCVKEIFAGGTHTLTLPYHSPADARELLDKKLNANVGKCGSTSWIFSELNTGNIKDFEFTVANTTYVKTDVRIDLYFGDRKKGIANVVTEMPRMCVQKISLLGGAPTENEAERIAAALSEKGLTENETFLVRFLSDVPIIVSHPDHSAAYCCEAKM